MINITQLASTTMWTGTYNLISFVGGTGPSFALGTISGLSSLLEAKLNATANDEQLIIVPSIPPVAYWQGLSGTNLNWSTVGNWTSDQAGSNLWPSCRPVSPV